MSAPLNRAGTQAFTVRTLCYLVDKLDWGLCEMAWTSSNWGELNVFFLFSEEDLQTLQLRLALYLGSLRFVWPKTEILCLFGSSSETTAQPICWWCSVVFSLSVFTAHVFLDNIYVRVLTLANVWDQKCSICCSSICYVMQLFWYQTYQPWQGGKNYIMSVLSKMFGK